MSDPTPDELTRLLRAGDPAAADPGLGAPEQAAIRRRLAAARERHRRTIGWLLPAATATALLALTLGLAWRSADPGPDRTAAARPSAMPIATTGRQIQFTTEAGTLVVWVLQPRATS